MEYLFKLERAGIKYDLENITELLKFLGNPHKKYPTVHIAGTNGKGSVSSMLNSILIEAGYTSALYTSPHIKDFTERMRVNGISISKKTVLEITNLLIPVIQKIKPSFFEVTTAMAFEFFKRKKVNIAFIEAGLGGRLDSTNVLEPILSIITSIDIDHTEFLGKTIKKIAYEKAGIVKNNIPVVTGYLPEKAISEVKKKAKQTDSILVKAVKENNMKILIRSEKALIVQETNSGKKYNLPLAGDYQKHNLSVVLSSLKILKNKYKVGNSAVMKGLKNVKENSGLYGRFELINHKPQIIVDVSHNKQGIDNIASNLKYFNFKKLIIIFAMMKDKEYRTPLRLLSKLNAHIILTRPGYYRSEEPEALLKAVKSRSKFTVKDSVHDSLIYSLQAADNNDLILVTGSFYLVSEFLNLFNKYYCPN